MENKIKVFNQFDNPVGEPAPVGDGLEPVMDYVKDEETGEVVYKEVGKTNLYDIIQAAKEGTDIHFIINKVNRGEMVLPDGANALYCDTTALPKDIHEASDMAKVVTDIYSKDPILQLLYPNADEYQKAFINGEVMEAYLKKVDEIKAQSIKEEAKPVNEVKKDEVTINE